MGKLSLRVVILSILPCLVKCEQFHNVQNMSIIRQWFLLDFILLCHLIGVLADNVYNERFQKLILFSMVLILSIHERRDKCEVSSFLKCA